MNLLPLVGIVVGFFVPSRIAYAVTLGLELIGITLVAILTDEIAGWWDPYVWGLTLVALLATWFGIRARGWVTRRRARRDATGA